MSVAGVAGSRSGVRLGGVEDLVLELVLVDKHETDRAEAAAHVSIGP